MNVTFVGVGVDILHWNKAGETVPLNWVQDKILLILGIRAQFTLSPLKSKG
jgi:hypothetical protein